MTAVSSGTLAFRRADESDLPAILELCEVALGWPKDPRNRQLFRWKHLTNPFGRSPMWVATAARKVVGFRAMMPWQFRSTAGIQRAVRAVDTATHPDFQRQGIFSALNSLAVGWLATEGIDFVFNTPNAESLPGYLKQGWVDRGPVPLVARPSGVRGAIAMASARGRAEKWSERIEIGVAPSEVTPLEPPLTTKLATNTTPAFFSWRFAGGPVHYRALAESGAGVVVRVRTRGRARELVLAYAWGTEVVVAKLVRQALEASRASYVVGTANGPGRSAMVPIPRVGPHLTVRALAGAPPQLDQLDLQLGDVELF